MEEWKVGKWNYEMLDFPTFQYSSIPTFQNNHTLSIKNNKYQSHINMFH
ncbi:MAG: hypothetical protein KAT40_02865 [Bacteroidales bacterium]|nr:hypothetical protein [Bacteroidales bacterium]